VPAFLGRREVSVPLAELVPFIDWTFFFHAWELKGRVPAIFDHPQYGHAARDLYDNARTLLDRIVNERLLEAKGVYGFWPAASDGDDVVLFADESRGGGGGALPDAAAAGADCRRAAEPLARRLRCAGVESRRGLPRAPSPLPRASAPTPWPAASRPTTTTTTPSW
jgi:hypothetical protein